jgi:uncharacterized protein
MLENEINTGTKFHPAVALLLIICLAGLGFVMGGVLVIFLYLPFFPGNENDLMEALKNFGEDRSLKMVLYAMQAGASVCGLLLAPYLFLRAQQASVLNLFKARSTEFYLYLIPVFIVVVSMGFNSMIIDWNQHIQLPESFQEFETWARKYEDAAAEQTRALTNQGAYQDGWIIRFVDCNDCDWCSAGDR